MKRKEYDIEFLTGTKEENAYSLMEKFKFPAKIRNDFKNKGIVYMSLLDGSLTTEFPEIVNEEIENLKPHGVVYHIIESYNTDMGITCHFYNLLFAEGDMLITDDYILIDASALNLDALSFSEIGKICIARNGKGMTRTR